MMSRFDQNELSWSFSFIYNNGVNGNTKLADFFPDIFFPHLCQGAGPDKLSTCEVTGTHKWKGWTTRTCKDKSNSHMKGNEWVGSKPIHHGENCRALPLG